MVVVFVCSTETRRAAGLCWSVRLVVAESRVEAHISALH